MIEKIQHYSLTNQASIFDEEALTALELAGRTAAKVNECVETVNDTVEALPGMVDNEVQAHINNGDFDKQVDKYAGDVLGRVEEYEAETRTMVANTNDSIRSAMDNADNALSARISALASLNEGSTTGDAELVDARVTFAGSNQASVGDAIRSADKTLLSRCVNYATAVSPVNTTHISIDTAAKTITIKEATFFSPAVFTVSKATTIPYETPTDSTKVLMLDKDGNIYIDYQGIIPRHFNDMMLCVLYLSASGKVNGIYGMPKVLECIKIDENLYGTALSRYAETAVAWGLNNGRLDINTEEKKITVSGYLFRDKTTYIDLNGDKTLTLDYSGIVAYEGTFKLLIRDNALKLLSPDLANTRDTVLADIWITPSKVRYIYCAEGLKNGVYVDGVKWFADNSIDVTKHSGRCLPAIFRKVVCVGDSYMAGDNDPAGYEYKTPNEDYAWPALMARRTGAEWVNCGHSGATAKSWNTLSRGLPKAQTSGKAQAYIIALGLNDGWNQDTFPLGVLSDIGDTSKNTYYRWYAETINNLLAISPNAHIFCETIPYTSHASHSAAVREIVAQYKAEGKKVHLLDLAANINLYEDVTQEESGHPSPVGQEVIADNLRIIMNQYMLANSSLFDDVPRLPYD